MTHCGVLLDDEARPATLYELLHISSGSAYIRPLDNPESEILEVCIDEFWQLT